MEALSALDWWQLAGVDSLVEDEPRDWLARVRAPATEAAAPVVARSEARALPATLAAMHALLADDPLFGDVGTRLAPEGDPASGLMVLIGMPEAEDAEGGHLLSGRIGLLFERMLAAIGRDRASIYLAAATPARPIGGRLTAEQAESHGRLALHHAALAAPRAMLLLGDGASGAILGAGLHETRGRVHEVRQGDATFRAVASFHPRFLLRHPIRKAAAWDDLRLLAGALAQ